MLELMYFKRRTFAIQAIQISMFNIEEVAEWCGGTVVNTKHGTAIQLNITEHKVTKQVQAYLGSYITKGKTFKSYTYPAFHSIFRQEDPAQFVKVRQLVEQIRMEQHAATLSGNYDLVQDASDRLTQQILDLL